MIFLHPPSINAQTRQPTAVAFVFFGISLLGLCGSAAGTVGVQVQLLELGGNGLGNDGFPVDVVHLQGGGHGAEQHDIHALGAAQILSDLGAFSV